MKLVKLEVQGGSEVWVNPSYVAFIHKHHAQGGDVTPKVVIHAGGRDFDVENGAEVMRTLKALGENR